MNKSWYGISMVIGLMDKHRCSYGIGQERMNLCSSRSANMHLYVPDADPTSALASGEPKTPEWLGRWNPLTSCTSIPSVPECLLVGMPVCPGDCIFVRLVDCISVHPGDCISVRSSVGTSRSPERLYFPNARKRHVSEWETHQPETNDACTETYSCV